MILARIGLIALAAMALSACETSQRFGGFGSPGLSPPPRAAAPDQVIAAPTPRVDSVPLGAPVTGAPPVLAAPPIDPLAPSSSGIGPASEPIIADLGKADPGIPPELRQKPVTTPAGQQTAALPPQAAPAAGPPTRTSVTGNWTLTEGAGGKCKVVLSSAPMLDLNKASSNGCASREMQRVSAWELRGSDIYLYEPGGAVAGRLQQAGQGRFSGAAAKTGAPLTLSK